MSTMSGTSAMGAMSVLVVACAGGASSPLRTVTVASIPPPAPASSDAPAWVLKTPRIPGSICATGAVDPTFFRQDGRGQAADSARNELARTIQVKVSSVMYDEHTTRGSYVDQAFVSEVVGSISDVVISGAQVEEYWYDETGAVSRKGMTYALACMPTDRSIADLAERLQAAAAEGADREQKIEEVRARAKAAFEELDTMERPDNARSGANANANANASPSAPVPTSPPTSHQ